MQSTWKCEITIMEEVISVEGSIMKEELAVYGSEVTIAVEV